MNLQNDLTVKSNEGIMTKQINGIQQLGVGVVNLEESFNWFNKNFGMDIMVFNEKAVAELMLPHTEGEKRERHAILALNMQGGGGFEIWQHTGKSPATPGFEIRIGDLGIAVGKLKTANIKKAYDHFSVNEDVNLLTKINKDPAGTPHFYMKDPYNNIWEFVQSPLIFKKTKANNGGILGCTIGVKNIDESLKVYHNILEYDEVVYDITDTFDDFQGIPGSQNSFRRVLLRHSEPRKGAFSPIFGSSEIELIQVTDREPINIFKNRIWGDPGFIHLCFDINDMDSIRKEVKQKGFPFTVDSSTQSDSFDMGEAAGNFSYIQAPEGTLIEFVETHKVPLVKKLGIYLKLRNRKPGKPLPTWMLNMFSLKRVKI
ncbi:MAG: VOC family protein [Prolixibacteraceae bacterium]|jgi:catechol 2,3-dioxygenase-like lactoylglutathione lyase family enzyme|nr:VOC family protein [Prolixibacteraceae bacterium]